MKTSRWIVGLTVVAWTGALAQDGEWKTGKGGHWDEEKSEWVEHPVKVWDSFPGLNLTFEWDGPVNEAYQAHGQGELRWRKSDVAEYDSEGFMSLYRGEMRNGMREGKGEIEYRSGAKYEGEWKENRKHGAGEYFYSDGRYYKGEFVGGDEHGTGMQVSLDGEVFEGSFREGKRHGSGTITLPGGERYESEWIDGAETEDSLARRSGARPGEEAGLQVGLGANPGKAADFRRSNQFGESITYQARFEDGEFVIVPDFPTWTKWKKGEAVKWFEAGIAPAYLDISMTNETGAPVVVTSGEVEVEDSETDLQPFLSVSDNEVMAFTVENAGWGPAENVKLEFNLFQQGTAEDSDRYQFTQEISRLEDDVTVDLKPVFTREGVKVDILSGDNAFDLVTEENARDVLGRFARISPSGEWLQSDVELRGRMRYTWTDSQGQAHQGEQAIEAHILLDPRQEFGAGGPADARFSVLLDLGRENYRIPLNFQKHLDAGESARVALDLMAKKSSFHRFRVHLKCSDGRVLSSPYCRLRLFVPRGQADYYFESVDGL